MFRPALSTLVSIIACAALHAAAPPARRFIIDYDGHNMFSTLTPDFRRDIDEFVAVLPANVTTFLLCPGAARYYYPTKVGEVDPRCKQLVAEHAAGRDPFGYFLEKLRGAGKETFVTVRMNDVHEPTAADEWNLPRVRREHPDVVVDPAAIARGDTDWRNWAIDYARPEVRAFMRAILAELLERYEFDGMQLDWMRFPRHLSGATPDEVWAKREHLTAFVAEARALCRARGRTLTVRVPTSIAGCRLLGIDLVEWVRRDLVDAVTTAHFLNTDFFQPIAETRAALGGAKIPLYAGFDCEHGAQRHNPESLRAAAAGLYASGADGLNLFNFPNWTERVGGVPWGWLAGLESPATAARKPLLFSVPTTRFRRAYELPGLLPAKLAAGETLRLPLPLPASALPAQRVRLLIDASAPVSTAKLNGTAIEFLAGQHYSELFLEYTDQRDDASRRPARDQTAMFRLPPELLRAGENTLELANPGGAPIEVRRVNLGLW